MPYIHFIEKQITLIAMIIFHLVLIMNPPHIFSCMLLKAQIDNIFFFLIYRVWKLARIVIAEQADGGTLDDGETIILNLNFFLSSSLFANDTLLRMQFLISFHLFIFLNCNNDEDDRQCIYFENVPLNYIKEQRNFSRAAITASVSSSGTAHTHLLARSMPFWKKQENLKWVKILKTIIKSLLHYIVYKLSHLLRSFVIGSLHANSLTTLYIHTRMWSFNNNWVKENFFQNIKKNTKN